MRKFRTVKEPDVGIRFNHGMHSITLHAADGRISSCWTNTGIDDPQKYVGTLPYQWIDPAHHAEVRAAIAAAARGKASVTQYILNPQIYGTAWLVKTDWQPMLTPLGESVLVAISCTLPALPKLTKGERALMRLLGSNDEASARALRAKSSIALRAAKVRLRKKLKISSRDLPAFCALYRGIL